MEVKLNFNFLYRITRPPGGESADIFGSSPTSTPPSTPRKVKNYMASSIFSADVKDGSGPVKPKARPDNDSFNRLFGENEGPVSPRKNLLKSNIIFSDGNEGKSNGHSVSGDSTPNGNGNGLNGHGSHYGSTSSISGSSSGSNTPSNGSINGDYKSSMLINQSIINNQ